MRCLALAGLAFSLILSGWSAEVERAGVPDAKQQKEAEKLIKSVFKKEYAKRTAANWKTLAAKLIKQGRESKDDPVSRYVLFKEAARLAAQGGEVQLAFDAIRFLKASYKVDVIKQKKSALGTASRYARSPEQFRALAKGYLSLAEDAVEEDQYLDAERFLAQAERAARRARSIPLITRIRNRKGAVGALQREYLQLKNVFRKLKTQPDDPSANLTAGKFLCFKKAKWKEGLRRLAKSGDAALKELARLELAEKNAPGEKAALADKWWNHALKERDARLQAVMRERAAKWYQEALPGLQGLAKARINKKLEALFGNAKIWTVEATAKDGVKLGGEAHHVGEVVTIEFWVATPSDDGVLLTQRVKEMDGSLTFFLRGGILAVAGDASQYKKAGDTKTRLNDGGWHHVAAVKKGLRVSVFVDGQPKADFETRLVFSSSSPWMLGYHGPWKFYGINAKFCKIRFSSVARYSEAFKPRRDYGKDATTVFMK